MLIPGCCPEGVVQFSRQQVRSICNSRISDTPYRLFFTKNGTSFSGTNNRTFVAFQVEPVSMGPQLGLPDCSDTDVREVGDLDAAAARCA